MTLLRADFESVSAIWRSHLTRPARV